MLGLLGIGDERAAFHDGDWGSCSVNLLLLLSIPYSHRLTACQTVLVYLLASTRRLKGVLLSVSVQRCRRLYDINPPLQMNLR